MTAAPARLDDTLSALQANGIGLDLETALDLLEGWQSDLEDAEFDGAGAVSDLLDRLQSQLEDPEPDGAALSELLADLSNAVQDAADAAPDELAGKLQVLGDLLGDMSEEVAAA